MLWQQIVNGLMVGAVYGAIGMGFSLVYGVMSIINLAHGSLIMIGSYIAFTAFSSSWHLDPFLSVPLAAAVLFVIGYLTQRYLINRVIRHGLAMTMVLTFGLDMVLINLALLLWSASYQAVNPSYMGSGLHLGPVMIPYGRLAVLVAALGITFLLYLFLNHTRIGNAIRATALQPEAAQLAGVEIEHIYALTCGVGSALAGAAGALLSTVFPLNPFMGAPFLGKAFTVAVLGGLGDVTGSVIGGLVLGVAEGLGVALLGTQYQQAVAFFVLIVILIIRPQGLLGRKFYR